MRGAPPRRRAALWAAAVVAVGAVLAASTGIAATSAAWTDRAYAGATVTAGTWPTRGTCTAMTAAGTPVGTCTITAMTYNAWGAAPKQLRDVYLTFHVSQPAATSYIAVAADLSAATATGDTSTGTWTWSTAIVTGDSTQFTPTSACRSLPSVTGRTVAGWDWSTGPVVWLRLADSKAAISGQPACS